jgi:hypothetical protein
MKKFTVILIVLLCFFVQKATAQKNIDASVFGIHQNWDNKNITLSWTTYTKNKLSVQIRTGFDAANTVAIIPGRIFKIKKTLIVPECGVLVGEYASISPEYYIVTQFRKLDFYLFGQYSIGLYKNNSFAYTYNQATIKYKNCRIGIGGQYHITTETKSQFMDIGPQVKVLMGKDKDFYIKPWFTFDPINHWRSKAILGIGLTI